MSEPDHFDLLIADLEARQKAAREQGQRINEHFRRMGLSGVCDNSGEAIDPMRKRHFEDRRRLNAGQNGDGV